MPDPDPTGTAPAGTSTGSTTKNRFVGGSTRAAGHHAEPATPLREDPPLVLLLRRVAVVATAGIGLAITVAGVAGTSTTTAAPSAQDRAFLIAAHQSNLTEIAAGKAAQQKATTQVVREHGALFIRDHTRLDASLQQVARTLGVDLPGTPNPAQQATLASVSAKSGSAFDQPG